MPTILPEGIRVPATGDAYALTEDLRKMMESATTIVPVANEAGRNALSAGLAAAGRPPSTTEPAIAWRADTNALEMNWGTGWKPIPAAATVRVTIEETAGYVVNQWTAMPLLGTPVAAQTDDPYGVFTIDRDARRVVVSVPGLYLMTARVVTVADGPPNMSQQLRANNNPEDEQRMDATLGVTSMASQARLSAGQGVDLRTFRYGGSNNTRLGGHLHITRISA